MKFLNGIFRLEFLSGFLPGFLPFLPFFLVFPFYKMLFMTRLEFLVSRIFLKGFIKPEKKIMVFFKIHQLRGL
jgi:hypothetical protein